MKNFFSKPGFKKALALLCFSILIMAGAMVFSAYFSCRQFTRFIAVSEAAVFERMLSKTYTEGSVDEHTQTFLTDISKFPLRRPDARVRSIFFTLNQSGGTVFYASDEETSEYKALPLTKTSYKDSLRAAAKGGQYSRVRRDVNGIFTLRSYKIFELNGRTFGVIVKIPLRYTLWFFSFASAFILLSGLVILFLSMFLFWRFMSKKDKEFAREALAMKDRAEAASRAKSFFLSNISHELKTPLNAILGMSAIAKTSSDPAKTERCLQQVEMSANHLLSLINTLLSFSKLEDGQLKIETVFSSAWPAPAEAAPSAQQCTPAQELKDDIKQFIDLEAGLKALNKNKKLYLRLLNNFTSSSLMEEFLAALESKDFDAARAKAHAIKGVSANLRLSALSSTFVRLESTGVENAAAQDLQAVYAETLSCIKQVLAAPGAMDKYL